MAFFGVTLEIIDKLEAIPGADRIEKATLRGVDFSFVVRKGQFKIGEKCVYIPVDAILPLSTQEKIGLVGKLSGKNKDRVRTVRLKGVYSEGIATDLNIIADLLKTNKNPSTEEITAYLGITKYEPEEHNADKKVDPEIAYQKSWPWYKRFVFKWFGRKWVKKLWGRTPGSLVPLNTLNLPVYDIESCNRYKDVVDSLMDQNVWITLKIEGQNAAVLCRNGKIYVNQRRFTIEKCKDNDLWKIAEKQRIIDFAKHLSKKYKKEALVYFEACGSADGARPISGNIYRFKDHRGYIFDIKIGDEYLNIPQMIAECNEFYKSASDLYLVPILCAGLTLRAYLASKGYESVEKAAEQKDILNHYDDQLEEGIVIHPEHEQTVHGLGRLILKYRSKPYKAIHE